jgi:hypothetical protein
LISLHPSDLTDVPASTLRYYESIGVITPVARREQYVENGKLGTAAAEEQIALLTERAERLADDARLIKLRQRNVEIKIEYWHAAAAGDGAEAERLAVEARSLVKQLNPAR